MSDNKPQQKKYYAINLTEGRVWILFILLLVLISIVTIVVVFVLKNNSNKNNNNLITNTSSSSSSAYFDYHTELGTQDELINPDKNKTSITKNDLTSDSLKAQIIDKSEKKDTGVITETKKNDSSSNIDNSEVVYSSKYKNNVNISKEQSKTINSTHTDKTKSVNNKTASAKSDLKRYAVQVGSYEDKKLVEEISIFYKMQGYPAYVEQKNKSGKIYYRLRVGPFKEKNNAEKYLATLKSTKYGKECMLWEFSSN